VDDYPADVADHVDVISAEDINDLRDHSIWAHTTTGLRDAAIPSPIQGQPHYLGNAATSEGLWLRNTAGQWRRPWNMPWGRQCLGTGQSTPTSASTTYVDLTTLATTESLPANRSLRWTLRAHASTTDTSALMQIAMRTTSNTLVDHVIHVPFPSSVLSTYVEVSSAGTVTRKISFQRALGSGTVSLFGDSTRQWRFWCLDEGPSGAPS
jgi:hypothetical protein